MAEVLYRGPTLLTGPVVGMGRVLGSRRIEVAVGLLGCGHDVNHAVDISLEFLIGIVVQTVSGTFDGFVDIGIVERKACHFVLLARVRGTHKVGIAFVFLALGKGQGDGHITTGLDTRTPEWARDMHSGKRHRGDGITGGRDLGHGTCRQQAGR